MTVDDEVIVLSADTFNRTLCEMHRIHNALDLAGCPRVCVDVDEETGERGPEYQMSIAERVEHYVAQKESRKAVIRAAAGIKAH
jgi:hypothetical protein